MLTCVNVNSLCLHVNILILYVYMWKCSFFMFTCGYINSLCLHVEMITLHVNMGKCFIIFTRGNVKLIGNVNSLYFRENMAYLV